MQDAKTIIESLKLCSGKGSCAECKYKALEEKGIVCCCYRTLQEDAAEWIENASQTKVDLNTGKAIIEKLLEVLAVLYNNSADKSYADVRRKCCALIREIFEEFEVDYDELIMRLLCKVCSKTQ